MVGNKEYSLNTAKEVEALWSDCQKYQQASLVDNAGCSDAFGSLGAAAKSGDQFFGLQSFNHFLLLIG